MSENKNNLKTTSDFAQLLEKEDLGMPKVGDIIKGIVITASKAEVKLDINGVVIGVVRGPELYEEADEYDDLKPGSTVEATVIDEENENGELELSFRVAGQEKAWATLKDAYENKNSIKVKIIEANKGGLLARYKQIQGFIPVSQLAPDNYPRVSGGDKSKILEKLRSFIGQEFEVKPITLDEKEDKIIFSEKDIWSEKQKDVIAKYQVGTKVEGSITAVTDFGVFISFGENLEGLIHISELAWQRIDDPNILYKVGDKIKAEVISVERSKIFLSAKNLLKDPWKDVEKKYKAGQIVKGKILKVNPFGLFVELDDDIHGLAHASQLEVSAGKKINDMFNSGEERDFEIVSIEPKEHRLGLKLADDKKEKKAKKEDEKEEVKEEKVAKEDKVDEEEVEAKEEKKKKPVKEKKEKKEDEGKK